MRFPRPSLAGRRLALQRKFELNLAFYGGRKMLLTVTAAGQDLLTNSETAVVNSKGGTSYLVDPWEAWLYEVSVQARMSRLFEAAQRQADRDLRRVWKGELPRQLANVRALMTRGVSHFHYLLPMETDIERIWSRAVVRHIKRLHDAERARWTNEERWGLLQAESLRGEVERGFYGLGKVNQRNPKAAKGEMAARYLARNAAGYVAGQAGRHYVSSRLTGKTGITLQVLRAVNYLFVRRKLIASGALEDSVIPSWWHRRGEDWLARVLYVDSLYVRGP